MGLTHGPFSLLLSLNRHEPPGMANVAAPLAMDRTTLTAALKPLVRRGLVHVTIDTHDRRRRLLRLTLTGRRLLARAVPTWQHAQAGIVHLLAARRPRALPC